MNNYLLFLIIIISTFSLTVIAERKLIPVLKRGAPQPIYLDGPRWHQSKNGTPTMGGLAFLIAITVSLAAGAVLLLLIGNDKASISLALSLLYAILNTVIGIIDDLTKLRRKHNAGLSAKQKLLFQAFSAILFLAARALIIGETETVIFAFGRVDLGLIYYPIAFIMLIATVNSANLTDGVDGLASSVAFAIAIALAYISHNTNVEVFLISAAVIGATTAFLIFNLHPARIFMGDTGSLLLGALVGASAVSLRNPFLTLLLGGVYLIEALSVLIQVASFKLTGKRVFKMAPLHHHLEQSGMSENAICIIAVLVTLILSLPAAMMYLP
jgi:phospho-N-acetylmuramoyl-pentapeptide-transferase